MVTGILIQAFGIFLMNGKHLVEHDFVLTVEEGELGDKCVEFCGVVGRCRVNQRYQPLVAVI
ncbi:hypothetical protein D3C87_2203960 [compost metagenome]